MKEDLGTVEYVSMLYDFYGALLSSSQNDIMSLYHEDNLSLSEIASELGMTRQAVHYTLKKAERALAGYEDKLQLLASYKNDQQLVKHAEAILEKDELAWEDRQELLDIIRVLAE